MKMINILCAFIMACFMASCSSDDDNNKKDESVRFPKFLYSSPTDQSVDVSLDTEVSIIYNTSISIAEDAQIKVNNEKIGFTINDRKLTLKISLEKNKTYSIVVPAGVVKNAVDQGADAVSLSFSTVSDTKLLEAEKAVLSGNAVVDNSIAGFSGTGYVNQKDGDITFKVNLPGTGKYKIGFRYCNGNQYKENDLVVNGVRLSTLAFDATTEWKTVYVDKVALKSGENTIAIKKNWGWIYLDYIDVKPADADIPFVLAENLVTTSSSQEAKNLYAFLKENFGKKVISGAMANYSTGIEEAQWMHDNTGKWPALTGFDFINYTRDWGTINFTELVSNAKEWWSNNGIVTIMWHWRDPLKKTDGFYTKDTSFDVSKMSDVNSPEYKALVADIDVVAGYLKQLQDNNIPVLWRPLHEASGKWFWWGAQGAEPCKALWKLMYDRLVNVHKLNNLIWVWTTDTAGDALNWYPGDNYVDVIGLDIYPGENQHGSQYVAFDKVKTLYGGKKIITLSECGSIPAVNDMFENGDVWSWIMPWNGDYTRSDKHNGATYLKSLFSDDRVITRDKMPSLK